jgi:hypothetical protein
MLTERIAAAGNTIFATTTSRLLAIDLPLKLLV